MQSFMTGFDAAMDSVKAAISAVISPLNAVAAVFGNIFVGAVLITAVFAVFLLINIRLHGRDFSGVIRQPKTTTVCAMMIAINVVLSFFVPVLSSYLKIEFGFVTLPIVSFLFGPLTGCVMGMVQDIVGLIVKPTGGLLLTLTLTDGITGMIYGMAFYKKPVTFFRVFLTQLIIVAAVNIVLNTIALAPTVASGLVGILPSRIIKNLLLLPIQSVIMYVLLKTIAARVKREQV